MRRILSAIVVLAVIASAAVVPVVREANRAEAAKGGQPTVSTKFLISGDMNGTNVTVIDLNTGATVGTHHAGGGYQNSSVNPNGWLLVVTDTDMFTMNGNGTILLDLKVPGALSEVKTLNGGNRTVLVFTTQDGDTVVRILSSTGRQLGSDIAAPGQRQAQHEM